MLCDLVSTDACKRAKNEGEFDYIDTEFYSHYNDRLKTQKLLIIVLAGACSDIAIGRIFEVSFKYYVILSVDWHML